MRSNKNRALNKIKLSDVTLVCIDGRRDLFHIKDSINALKYSKFNIDFFKCILFSPKSTLSDLPTKNLLKNLGIDLVNFEGDSILHYNNFVIKKLNNFIDSNFVLIVQSDGFVLNPHLWQDKFLNFDYIGAPWEHRIIQSSNIISPKVKQSMSYSLVGNGGFSLRSKKLLIETQNSNFEIINEDAYICAENFKYFNQKSINFAPIELAKYFSWDHVGSVDISKLFGFHSATFKKKAIKYVNIT